MKSIGKNKLKDIYKLHFNQLLNQISDTEYLYANDQDAKKDFAEFDRLFREYANQVTGMRSDEEKNIFDKMDNYFYKKLII